MNSKKYRVALIGCGVVSLNHLYALSLMEEVTVVAVCDIIEERAKEARDKLCVGAHVYTDYKEMLECEKPDAVHIATPHYLHAEMTIFALQHNINVFLEKPMCISTNEIEALISAEKKSAARVCVSFQNRFISATKKALEIVKEDGGALTASFSLFWKRDEKYYTGSGWRGKYATEGGGVMINQAIHSLDLLTIFLGKPTSVCATTANHHLKGIIEVEDSCEGVITFEGGKRANFYATTAAVGADFTTVTISTKNHLIRLDLPNMTVDGKFISFEHEHHTVGKECYGNGHVKLISEFYSALSSGGEMPVTLESAQYAVIILLAAYKSHDTEIII